MARLAAPYGYWSFVHGNRVSAHATLVECFMSVKLRNLAMADRASPTEPDYLDRRRSARPRLNCAIDYLRFSAAVSSELPRRRWRFHELEGLSTPSTPEQQRQDLPERNRRT